MEIPENIPEDRLMEIMNTEVPDELREMSGWPFEKATYTDLMIVSALHRAFRGDAEAFKVIAGIFERSATARAGDAFEDAFSAALREVAENL